MENPIGKNDMFATPENMAALSSWLEHLDIHGLTGAMMAWNYASAKIDNAIAEERAAKEDLSYYSARAYRDRRNAG